MERSAPDPWSTGDSPCERPVPRPVMDVPGIKGSWKDVLGDDRRSGHGSAAPLPCHPAAVTQHATSHRPHGGGSIPGTAAERRQLPPLHLDRLKREIDSEPLPSVSEAAATSFSAVSTEASDAGKIDRRWMDLLGDGRNLRGDSAGHTQPAAVEPAAQTPETWWSSSFSWQEDPQWQTQSEESAWQESCSAQAFVPSGTPYGWHAEAWAGTHDRAVELADEALSEERASRASEVAREEWTEELPASRAAATSDWGVTEAQASSEMMACWGGHTEAWAGTEDWAHELANDAVSGDQMSRGAVAVGEDWTEERSVWRAPPTSDSTAIEAEPASKIPACSESHPASSRDWAGLLGDSRSLRGRRIPEDEARGSSPQTAEDGGASSLDDTETCGPTFPRSDDQPRFIHNGSAEVRCPWSKYCAPETNRVWYWNQISQECFFADSPGDWQQYFSDEFDQFWWWNNRTSQCFFEPTDP